MHVLYAWCIKSQSAMDDTCLLKCTKRRIVCVYQSSSIYKVTSFRTTYTHLFCHFFGFDDFCEVTIVDVCSFQFIYIYNICTVKKKECRIKYFEFTFLHFFNVLAIFHIKISNVQKTSQKYVKNCKNAFNVLAIIFTTI